MHELAITQGVPDAVTERRRTAPSIVVRLPAGQPS
jgi:hypothetical protein